MPKIAPIIKRKARNPLAVSKANGGDHSPAVRLRAKAMYLDRRPWSEIEHTLNVSKQSLQAVCAREQWALLRQNPDTRGEAQRMIADALREFEQTVSVEAQSLTLDALPMVRQAITDGSPRDLKDSTQGIKTLVEIARATSGVDADAKAQGASASGGINMFFFSGPVRRANEPTPVEPVAVVSALDDPEFA